MSWLGRFHGTVNDLSADDKNTRKGIWHLASTWRYLVVAPVTNEPIDCFHLCSGCIHCPVSCFRKISPCLLLRTMSDLGSTYFLATGQSQSFAVEWRSQRKVPIRTIVGKNSAQQTEYVSFRTTVEKRTSKSDSAVTNIAVPLHC